ncbi:hypothetical protein HDU81_005511 [Chytriomyces hyalinus]|nr:hypothetical protein HDU81_005511 [Chytriomyces hyalinus]
MQCIILVAADPLHVVALPFCHNHSHIDFLKAPQNDTPGPTDYEVKVSLVSDDRNKKFGFINSSKRFRSPKSAAAAEGDESGPALAANQPQQPVAVPMSRISTRTPALASETLKLKREAERWQEQYERQLLNHQRDMSQLEERLARLDIALKEALREKNSLASSAIAKEKELAELTHRHALLKSSLEKSDKTSINLAEKATRSSILERKITDLEKTSAKTRSLVDAKTTTLEKLQFERNELRDQCDSLSKQVWELVDEKSRRDVAYAEAESQREELVARVAELEDIVAQAGGATAEREKELIDRLAMIQEHSDEISKEKVDLQARLQSITRALEAARFEMNADKSKVASLQADIDSHKSLLNALEMDKADWLATRMSMENHAKQLLAKLETAQGTITTLDGQKLNLEKLVGQMEARNIEVASILAKLEASVEEREQQLIALEDMRRTEHEEYEDVIESLKAALLRFQTEGAQELTTTQMQLHELTSHLETGMHEIMRRDQMLEAMTAQEEELRMELEATKAELAATTEVYEAFRLNFDEVNAVRNQLAERLVMIEEELLMTSNDLSSTKMELQVAREHVSSLQSDIYQLNIALDEATDALRSANANHADATAIHESQMNELNEQLEQERTYRAGERDMTELRIASIEAAALDSMQGKVNLIAELEQHIEALKDEIQGKADELAAIADSHRKELGQVKLELSEQTEMVNEYRERAYDHESAAEGYQNQIYELEKKVKARGVAAAHEAKEMETAFKTIISEFREKIDVLESEKEAVKKSLAAALAEAEGHQHRLGDSDENLKALMAKQTSLQDRIDGLTQSLNESQAELEASKQKIAEISAEKLASVSSLEAMLFEAKAELEKAYSSARDNQATWETDSVSLNSQISNLNGKLAGLEQSLEEQVASSVELRKQLDAKNVELSEAVAAHRAEVLDLTVQLTTARSSFSDLQAAMDALSNEHLLATARVKELGDAIQHETSRHAETMAMATSLDSDLSAERISREELSTKVAELELLLASEQQESRSRQSQIDVQLEIKSTLEAEIKRLSGDCDAQKSLYEELKAQSTAALQIERETVLRERRRSDDLSLSLNFQISTVNKLTAELVVLKASLEEETAAREEKEEKISTLLSELESERNALDSLYKRGDELDRALQLEREAHLKAQNLASELSETLMAERASNQKILENLKVSLESVQKDLKSAESALALEKSAHAASIQQFELKENEYRSYHDASKANVSLLVAALQEANDVSKSKDEKLAQLSNDLADCRAKLDGSEMERESLKSRAVASVEAIESERTAHRETVAELQDRNERLARALNEREATIKELSAEVVSVKVRQASEAERKDAEIRHLMERLKQMEQESSGMKAALDSARRYEEELASVRTRFEQTMQMVVQENRELAEGLEQNAAEIHNLKKDNDRLQESLTKAEQSQAEVEETLSAHVQFLQKNYKAAFDDIKKLSSDNASLLGHQNAQQKIRHIAKLKEELVKLKQENTAITRERDMLKRRNLVIERDLESFKVVVPKPSHSSNENVNSYEAPSKSVSAAPVKRVSRAGRSVLEGRTKGDNGAFTVGGMIGGVLRGGDLPGGNDKAEKTEDDGRSFFIAL